MILQSKLSIVAAMTARAAVVLVIALAGVVAAQGQPSGSRRADLRELYYGQQLTVPTTSLGVLGITKIKNTSNTTVTGGSCGYVDSSGQFHLSGQISIGPSQTVEQPYTIPGASKPFSIVPFCATPIDDPPILVNFTFETSPTSPPIQILPGLVERFLAMAGPNDTFVPFIGLPNIPNAQGCTTGPLFTGGGGTLTVWNPLPIPQEFTFTEQKDSGVTAPLSSVTVPAFSTGSTSVTLDLDASINVAPTTGLFNVQLNNGTQVTDKEFLSNLLPLGPPSLLIGCHARL
jgi:hypothetical protein